MIAGSFPRRLLLLAVATALAGCGDGPAPEQAPPATTPPPSPSATVRTPSAELDAQLRDAAWAGDARRAAALVAQGADVDAKDETEQSPYLIAASEGHLEVLRLALRSGADVNALDSFDGTALIRAAERGHALVVGELLRAGVAPDHVNRLGYQAVHEAVWLGRGDANYAATVRVLLAAGAAVDTPSTGRVRLTPVQMAEQRGYLELAATLRAANKPVAPERASATLLDAARTGDADLAARALRAGAQLEVRDAAGRTPLLLAAAGDHVPVAGLLVALGADPDALDDRHDTPWLVTGVTGSVAMLQTLLPAHPDLSIENRFGGLSVIPASERGHVAYVRRVVQTGIDVDHVNRLGWTALLEAIILGDGGPAHQQIVDILLAAGADPTITDAQGVAPLQHARQRGHAAMVASLERAMAGE